MICFTTHTKEKVSGERLTKALNKVADDWANNAREVRREDPYASHVTEEEKDEILRQRLAGAEEVRAGNIKSFTAWQCVDYELTGKSVAFLP